MRQKQKNVNSNAVFAVKPLRETCARRHRGPCLKSEEPAIKINLDKLLP